MTDPGRLARRAQLAVLLDRADRLTVDEAALLRTIAVAELATTPARITGDPMTQPQTPPTCPSPLRRIADAADQVDAGVRAAAETAVRSYAKALGATREEFALTGPAADSPATGNADGPLLLDRAAAVALRDCLNQLLGDEPAVGTSGAALHTHGGTDAAPDNGAAVRRRMLRKRYAADVERAIGLNAVFGAVVGVHRIRDAVLAVRDDEVARLRAELAEAIDGWNEERIHNDATCEAAVVLAARDDEVARLRAELEAQRATPRELELRQRRERVAAGRCPMCGRADTDGRLCGDCASTVRALPSHNRRQWRCYEPPNPYPPIQGPGYTPAGLLGMDLDDSPQEH